MLELDRPRELELGRLRLDDPPLRELALRRRLRVPREVERCERPLLELPRDDERRRELVRVRFELDRPRDELPEDLRRERVERLLVAIELASFGSATAHLVAANTTSCSERAAGCHHYPDTYTRDHRKLLQSLRAVTVARTFAF